MVDDLGDSLLCDVGSELVATSRAVRPRAFAGMHWHNYADSTEVCVCLWSQGRVLLTTVSGY